MAAVIANRRIGKTVTCETGHVVSSLPADSACSGQAVRAHWCIKHRLH
jgi:hypothetical protein